MGAEHVPSRVANDVNNMNLSNEHDDNIDTVAKLSVGPLSFPFSTMLGSATALGVN